MSDIEITRTSMKPVPNHPDTKTVIVELTKVNKKGKIIKRPFRFKQNFAHEDAEKELSAKIKEIVTLFDDDNSPENILENAIEKAIEEIE